MTAASSPRVRLSVVILAGIVSLLVIFLYSKSSIFRKIQKGQRINMLLVGADQVMGGSHADVVLWVSYQPVTRFVDIVSVPRDALIKWDRWIPRKLSEILYLNTKEFGMDEGINRFVKELEGFLGIRFNYHTIVTLSAFEHFIDAIGPVPVTIDRPMHYDDNWGNLHIHFEPGEYLLNGKKALEFVRFRHSSLGDLGRINRQHMFLKNLLVRAIDFRTFLAIPRFLRIYREDIFTNISLLEILPVFEIFRTINVENQRYQIFPGAAQKIGSKEVWKLDGKLLEEIKITVLNSQMELWPRSRIRPFLIKRKASALQDISAEVFNASKKSGIAEYLSKNLREYGCDVVLWDNWGSFKKRTEVVARTGDLAKAVRVAKTLGCNHVRTEIDPHRMVDVSIVIGDDFPKVFKHDKK
ncbi:MAG: LCP family protein [bacterium]